MLQASPDTVLCMTSQKVLQLLEENHIAIDPPLGVIDNIHVSKGTCLPSRYLAGCVDSDLSNGWTESPPDYQSLSFWRSDPTRPLQL
jgi:hypothetical protein